MFFNTWWVMVEPPWLPSPTASSFTAYSVRIQSTPSCWKNRLSSTATAACHRYLDMSLNSTKMRFSSPWMFWNSFHCPDSLS